MNNLRKIYILGMGAVGAAYAARIQENCPGMLKILADKERTDRYKTTGIIINGKTICFDFIQPDEVNELADLIIIATKQHHLPQVIKDIRKLVGQDTIILSLLNGVTSEEILGREYGSDKLLHAFCVGIDSLRNGTDIKYENIGTIVFGDKDGSALSPKVRAVKALFDKALVPYKIPDDIIREQWWKYMMNVGLNQVSAVLRAPYGMFTTSTFARDLMFDASREVISIAQRIGVSLNEDDIKKYFEIIKTISPNGKTSMLQDIEAGRKTEVEMFSGAVVQMGLTYEIPTPVNSMLFRVIKALEEVY